MLAAQILLHAKPPLLGIVAFHAQQSVEKYLKAYLVWRQIDFPKTHNIGSLLMLISDSDEKLAQKLKPSIILSAYAVESRYPGDIPELSLAEAEDSINLANKAQNAILERLKDFVE